MLNNLLKPALLAILIATTTALPVIVNVLPSHLEPQIQFPDQTASPAAAPTYINRPSEDDIRELQRKLILAPSWKARQKILIPNPPKATNMVYQFVNNSVKAPTGGTIAVASIDQFPALWGMDMSFGVGFINPCGLNVPHSHPRANEILVVHQGFLTAGFVLEDNTHGAGNIDDKFPNGGPMGPIPMVSANLSDYKGMLFPKGLTHWQFNPTCEPAAFTASFDSADPGRMQIAQTFFSILPVDVLLTATGNDLEILGPHNLERLRNMVPNSFVQLVDSCVKRCFPGRGDGGAVEAIEE